MSLKIADDHVVTIHYTLKDESGEIVDSSEGMDPLVYLQGAENIVPGLEHALAGKQVGDKLSVTVQPKDGYGELIPELCQVVSIDMFQGVDELEIGQMFETESAEGYPMIVTITEISEGNVTIDANHPLAGQVLNFAVEVVDVREASEEELEHGHVHGEGCHHH
jgi:FKBP-type peptidyl-prolyl cis-trans isomerase SlyD